MNLSTTTEAVAAAAGEVICTACEASVAKPADCQWRPLWEAGWRWLGTMNLYSCPECPPVVLVDEQGRHKLGPGAVAAPPANRAELPVG